MEDAEVADHFVAATKAGAWNWWLIFFSASCREIVQGRIFQITAVYSRGGRVSRHSLAQNKLTSSFILALQLPASTRPLLVRGYQARIVSILPTQRPVKPAQKGLLRIRTSGKMPDFAGFRNMIQRQIFGDETSNQYGYNMAKKGFPNRTSYLCICPLPV